MRYIYLDNNATTPIAPSVQEAMAPFLNVHYGNPSSSHALGRACEEAVEDARARVAAMLGAEPDEIVFTSGGSESDNFALKGVLMRRMPAARGHLVVSAIEHPAVAAPARFLQRLGFSLSIAPCDGDGVVSPDAVKSALRPDTVLVSVMHANNETGVIQPIREIARLCHERGVLVHADAAQSVGKIRVFVNELEADLLTVAGHKFYAPKGIGALYVRPGVALEPLHHGAAHEAGRRAGTESVPLIVALGAAAQLAAKGLDDAGQRLASLRDRLLDLLRSAIGPRLTVNGERAERLPNTLSVNFPSVDGGRLLARTPELCASTGAACHAGAASLSPTLAAMGLSLEQVRGCVRLSLGWQTSEEDVQRAASLLLDSWERLQSS